jgi:hypothetical protein
METVTYNQVQALLRQLPETKLQTAYRLLADLINSDRESLPFQQQYMSLPLDERHRIMAQQAEQIKTYYQKYADERRLWQGGDFIEEYSAGGDMDSLS